MTPPPSSPLELLKDPYLYIIGLFGWLSVELLKTSEQSLSWYIGLMLLAFSSILLLVRFVISLYRDYFESYFRRHFESVIESQSKLLADTNAILATQSSTDKMAHQVAQQALSKNLANSEYVLDQPTSETGDGKG